MDQFILQLEPTPSGVYFSGQTVSGFLVVVNNSELSFKELYVKVKGFTHISWKTGDDSYHDDETHINLKIPNTSLHEVRCIRLAPGTHRFSFSFTLPHSLPMSIEMNYGCYVRYTVKAVMKRPGLRRNYAFVKPITVNKVVDVNNLDTPLLFYNNRKFVLQASIDKCGYVPGENILFNASILNCSGKTVRRTHVRLVQNSCIISKGVIRDKWNKILVQHKNQEKLKDKNTQVWFNVPIRVPPCPPSGPPNCNLIKISYVFELVIDQDDLFSKSATYSWNVVIGNVRSHSVASAEVRNLPPLDPIRSPANSLVMQGDRFPMSTSTYNSPFTQVLAINGQSNDAINHSSAHEESEIEIPPPSYEECVAQRWASP